MLHWGLETLGQVLSDEVSKTFPEAFCDPFYTDEHPPALPCLDNTTGEPLFHIPSTRMRLISRRRFRKVLSRGLDVRYSKKLEQFVESDDGSLILVFADGAQYDADIIVGADGPKSIVRTQLLGEETSAVLKSPWVISITLFTCDDPEKAYFIRKLHPVWHMVYGPTGIAGIAGELLHHTNL